MKILITDYLFDASSKTVTFNDYGTTILENVLLITNVTDNLIIYNFAGIGKGGTVATNVLTLDYDTTAMADTDDLQIWYWDETVGQTISGSITANAGTNLNTSLLALEGGGNLAAILAKIISTPATEAKQDTLIAKDYATQTTLAAVLAKIIAAPATETTVAAILAKIIAAPATEAKQDTLIAKDFATQTTLAAVLAKIIAAPATEATLATLALEATQLLIKAKTDNIDVALSTRLKPADTLTAVGTITNPVAVTDNAGSLTVDNAGTFAVQSTLQAGSAIAGKFGIDQTTPGTTNAVRNTAGTSGGATPYKLISAASTNATSVKGSAATLYGIQVYNINAAVRYLKLYNKASAPTVGTDTPVKVITIPGSTTGAGSNVSMPSVGVAFGTGLAFAITTGAADSDTGAVAANEIITNMDYN